MSQWKPRSDAVHWYMQELSSRVVTQSGNPDDRHHLGKLILQGLKDAPDFILQIDGATDESETFSSALKRSIRCATAFRKLGLEVEDVVLLMAPNHIHLTIPFYAALFLGLSVAGIDRTLEGNNLRETFKFNKPKIVFCQSERGYDVKTALEELNLNAHIVTFDKNGEFMSFDELLEKYGDDTTIEEFKAADINPETTTALLISTSGTTGLPKSAAVTHKNFAVAIPYMWVIYDKFPTPTRLPVVFSPIQWYSALFQFVFSPILRNSRLQSSALMTVDHAYYLINKYRPTFTMCSPCMISSFFKLGVREKCDFSSFEIILAGGNAVKPSLMEDIKAASPNTRLIVIYGMSEAPGIAFHFDDNLPTSLGRPVNSLKHKLMNPKTLKDVTEPNVPGELWVHGPSVFKGYQNNQQETSQMIVEGGWLRTGDMMYRDEHWNFYYVERLKLLLKYKNHEIWPLEIENVIGKHPGVYEVAVTSVRHEKHGDLPVACVVLHDGFDITAQEIKNMVKNSLTDSKQLRGGVIFMKELPLTSTTKVDRSKLAAMVRSMNRE